METIDFDLTRDALAAVTQGSRSFEAESDIAVGLKVESIGLSTEQMARIKLSQSIEITYAMEAGRAYTGKLRIAPHSLCWE
jgi:hypothetical protein